MDVLWIKNRNTNEDYTFGCLRLEFFTFPRGMLLDVLIHQWLPFLNEHEKFYFIDYDTITMII